MAAVQAPPHSTLTPLSCQVSHSVDELERPRSSALSNWSTDASFNTCSKSPPRATRPLLGPNNNTRSNTEIDAEVLPEVRSHSPLVNLSKEGQERPTDVITPITDISPYLARQNDPTSGQKEIVQNGDPDPSVSFEVNDPTRDQQLLNPQLVEALTLKVVEEAHSDLSFTQTPAYERSNAENKRESLSNTTVINDNVPCLNNVATLTADVISALLASQEIPFELHGAFLGTQGNKIQKDARKKVTDLNLSAYPMRKVTNKAEINIPVDLPVNSEDEMQPSVPSHRSVASRIEPKRHPNTYRKIKEWNLEVIKPHRYHR